MPEELFIGIDPGKKGGVGVINKQGKFLGFFPCPPHPREMSKVIKDIQKMGKIVFAVVEKAMIVNKRDNKDRDGRKQGAKGMLNFGKNAGIWIGTLLALDIPFEELYPQRWQKILGITKKKGDPRSAKERAASFVLNRWPEAPVDLKHKSHMEKADAICMAECARRIILGVALEKQTGKKEVKVSQEKAEKEILEEYCLSPAP